MKEILENYGLASLLRGELFRSESFEDFITWINGNDRKAQDVRNLIVKYELQALAKKIIAGFRRNYAGKPETFALDKETCPV